MLRQEKRSVNTLNNIDNIFECYLTSENPIAFLKGNKMLEDFGLHTGTRISFKRGKK